MENTDKLQFKDDAPKWFVAIGDSWVGPLFASEVYKKIIAGEITWAHYIWTPAQSSWNRICDTDAFSSNVPQKPGKELMAELKGASTEKEKKPAVKTGSRSLSGAKMLRKPSEGVEKKDWFLYFNDSQFGPFSREEVRRFLKVGKINERVHAWKDGMPTWERISGIAELSQSSGKTKPGIPKMKLPEKESTRADLRIAPRRPMIARILLANDGGVIAGVCRDISVGGMQVLTDKVPGPVGMRIKLNVSPTGPGAPNPFAAEGEIVRILEDGLGFSFRFETLDQRAKDAIEKYINEI